MLRDAPTTFWRWTFRRLFFYQGHLREKNLSIPAAAGFLSLDASSGLLATATIALRRRQCFSLWALAVCGVKSCMTREKKYKKIDDFILKN